MRRNLWLAAAMGLILSGAAWGAMAAAGEDSRDDRGVPTEPDPYASMPDRIGVLDRSGHPVGTVSKADLQGDPDEAERATIPVLGPDGALVGHMVPAIGFVSTEESSAPGYHPAKLEGASPTTTVVGRADGSSP